MYYRNINDYQGRVNRDGGDDAGESIIRIVSVAIAALGKGIALTMLFISI